MVSTSLDNTNHFLTNDIRTRSSYAIAIKAYLATKSLSKPIQFILLPLIGPVDGVANLVVDSLVAHYPILSWQYLQPQSHGCILTACPGSSLVLPDHIFSTAESEHSSPSTPTTLAYDVYANGGIDVTTISSGLSMGSLFLVVVNPSGL